jgi:Trp operon repressor
MRAITATEKEAIATRTRLSSQFLQSEASDEARKLTMAVSRDGRP